MTAEQPLLVANEIVAGYLPEIDILRGCSFELDEGEIVGIIGPNGAGKSTLIKAMFGLVEVRSGEVRLRGDPVTHLRPHELVKRGVGYVPQTNNVFPRLTVRENLEMGSYLRPADFPERFAEVSELFPVLAERQHQRAGNLSGGERQMVATARALMMSPSVLLLDEPSAGLSPMLQEQIFEQVAAINRSGVSIVIVEQNARRCLQLCHRGYVLDQGRQAYTGSGDALLDDQRVIELYLGTLGSRR